MWTPILNILCIVALFLGGSLPAAHATSVVQRVFTDKEGLAGTSVRSLAVDDYGFVWVATEQGLYRVSNAKVRRIDKIGAEGRLEDDFFNLVANVDRDHLLVSTNSSIYLYNFLTNQFTPFGSPELFPEFQNGTLVSVSRKNDQQWLLLMSNGRVYEFILENQSLKLIKQLPFHDDNPWRKVIALADGRLLLAGKYKLVLTNMAGETQLTLPWTVQQGSISDVLLDSQQRIWIATNMSVYRLDLANNAIHAVPEVPEWNTMILEDPKGYLWFSNNHGLKKWHPDTGELIDYQAELKAEANIEKPKAMVFDSTGLLWVGGYGDGVALLVPKADFLLDSYSAEPPYRLEDPMTWTIYEDQQGLWLGSSLLILIPHHSHKTIVIPIDGLKPATNVYDIKKWDERHLLVFTSSGLFVVDTEKHQGIGFAQWTKGKDILANKVILNAYFDPHITGRLWIITSSGLYFWEAHLAEPQLFDLEKWGMQSSNKSYPLIFKVYRATDGKFWISGEKIFGYFDDNWQFKDMRSVFKTFATLPNINHIQEMSPGEMWFGTYERGLFAYSLAQDKLTSLTQQWGVNCSAILFLQKTVEANFIGCAGSLIRQDVKSSRIQVFDQKDGFISDELNEGAYFFGGNQHFYVGTPDGVMRLDAQALANRLTNIAIKLESVSVYYDEATEVSLLPQPHLVIQPNANMVSFQMTNLDYLDDAPIQLKYRLRSGGELDNYVLLQGESQITLAGLAAGEYQLDVLSQVNGVWSEQPFLYPFTVKQHWWTSQGFKIALLLLLSLMALSFAWYRHRQIIMMRKMNQALTDSDDRLRQSLRGSESDLWEWHKETQMLHLDNRGSVLGRHTTEIIVPLHQLPIHPQDKERVINQWRSMLSGELDRFEVEYRYRREDSDWGWLRVRGRPVARHKHTHEIERVAGIYSDITLQRQLEDEVDLLAQAFENTSEGVLILAADERIKVANHAAQQIIGADASQLVGQSFSQFVQMEGGLATEIAQLLNQAQSWTGERELLAHDGKRCPVWLNVSLMNTTNEQLSHYVVVFSDMTERKKTEAELRRIANFDLLTGLPNRALFNQKLLQSIAAAQQSEDKLALLFLDLDRFKHVNDSYGHGMGDALLVEAARRLQSCLSADDLLCRFGGDEFVILLHHANNLDDINHLAEKVLEQIIAPFRLFGREFYISTSIGISLWPDDALQPEAFIKNADLAMYHAKEEGRGNVKYYSHERNAQALYHLHLEADLRKAIERQEFEVYYQPQVNILRDDKLVGMEALLRWRHPKEGFISPDLFIKLAESCGLIVDIDRFVLRQACLQGSKWLKNRVEPFKIAVNISAMHFRQPDFIEGVQQILAQTGMLPSALGLEITEGVLMKELQCAQSHLEQLKALGVEVAIDDFGTGYSSLAYLRHFQVNSLKIDRSFLIDIATNPADQAIVSSIIELARNLKLTVVAEGVETLEQLEQVFSRGCYLIQGYYFAAPMSVRDAERYLLLEESHELTL
ncbi:MAG: EAL domain-containing protein [Shewanella sp.]